MTSRRLAAGVVPQGTDETVEYKFDFKKFVGEYGAPTGEGACTLYDKTSEADVSATKLSGAASLTGNVVTTKLVAALEEDHQYQLNQAAEFTGGLIFSGYILIRGER